MNGLSLRQNFAWTLSGQIVYTLGQWGIVALLARQGTPTMVGQLALAIAFTTPVITFTNLRLRSIQASDSLGEFEFSHYFGLRLLATIVGFLAILGLAWAVAGAFATVLAIAFVGLAKSFEAISDVFYGLQQQQDRMDRVARSNVVRGVSSVVAFYIGWHLSGEVYGGAAAWSIAWLGVLVLVDLPASRVTFAESRQDNHESPAAGANAVRPDFSFPVLRSLLWLAVPLGLTSTVAAVSTNVPRYVIEFLRDTSEVGIFSAMIYPVAAGSLLVGALAQSSVSRMSRSYRRGDTRSFLLLLRKLMIVAAAIGALGLLAALVVGRDIVQLLYGSEYVKYSDLLVWAAAISAIRYSYLFLGTALNAMRLFDVQLPIHIFSLVVLVMASVLLVQRAGLQGAMAALMVAAIVEAGLYAAVIWRTVKRSVDDRAALLHSKSMSALDGREV